MQGLVDYGSGSSSDEDEPVTAQPVVGPARGPVSGPKPAAKPAVSSNTSSIVLLLRPPTHRSGMLPPPRRFLLQPMRASQKRKMAKGPSLAEKRRMLMAAPVLQVRRGTAHSATAWTPSAALLSSPVLSPVNPLLHLAMSPRSFPRCIAERQRQRG